MCLKVGGNGLDISVDCGSTGLSINVIFEQYVHFGRYECSNSTQWFLGPEAMKT